MLEPIAELYSLGRIKILKRMFLQVLAGSCCGERLALPLVRFSFVSPDP